MRFYGSGVLRYPGTSRTVHDFEDGPFDTVNPDIIRHALNMGFTTKPPDPLASLPEKVKIESNYPESPDSSEPKDTPKKRGRPAKGKENVNATTDKPS